MKRLFLLGTTLVALMSVGMSAQAAGDAAAGKRLFLVCSTCHGVNGEGKPNVEAPRIGGQYAWYIERQLQNFQNKVRGAHADDTFGMRMLPMSRALPINASPGKLSSKSYEKSTADVAAYIETLSPSNPAPSVQGDAAAGKASFMVCQGCHGADGAGNKAMNAPKISGQHGWYLARQIGNFKAGIRGTNPADVGGMQMRPMAATLPDDAAVNNVIAYIQTLK